MKHIALFGASGQSGQHFLEQALEKGYTIRALVRSPEKITQRSAQLTIIQGDVLRAEDVDRTVAGSEVVVSLFGHVKGSPAWLQRDGTQQIVDAMQRHQVDRIISLSGGGLPYPEKDRPKLTDHLIRTIMKIAVPKVLNDAVAHYEVLRNSGLKWTIVRAPRLTQEERRGSYRTGWVGVNAGIKLGRADLADFLLQQVEDERFVYELPFVTY